MARVNVYLPDDLHNEVKDADIEVSAVCQAALRNAVLDSRRSKHEQLDLLAAVRRISHTAAFGPLRRAEGHKAGWQWAMHAANLEELQQFDDPEFDTYEAIALDAYPTLEGWLRENTDLDADVEFDSDPKAAGRRFWQFKYEDFGEGFVAGAREFWTEAKPLLDQSEAMREQRAETLRSELQAAGEAPF